MLLFTSKRNLNTFLALLCHTECFVEFKKHGSGDHIPKHVPGQTSGIGEMRFSDLKLCALVTCNCAENQYYHNFIT